MNAARRLHNTLLDWQALHTSGSKSVGGVRELDDDDGMVRQLDALDDLRQVEELLDTLEEQGVRVGVSRRYLGAWRQMVLGYPQGWTYQADPNEVYPDAEMDQLETLADRIDERLPDLTDAQKASLKDIVSEAFELMHADETLSDSLKLYLGRIIGEIQNALLDEEYGQRFDYREAAQRLWVTLMAATEQSTDEERKPRWREATKRFLWDASVSAIGNAPSVFLALPGLS